MTSMLAVLVSVAITSINGQWNNFGGGNFGQWNNFRGGNFQRFPQSDPNEANRVNCFSEYGNNVLEVVITPQQNAFFGGGSPYSIEVIVTSYDIEGEFTLAVTELSTDNPVCMESDLGFIANNGQSPNNGLLSLLTGQIRRPQSAGVIGEIDVHIGEENTETFTYNTLYRNFREFRGLGVGLCTDVSDDESSANNFNPFLPVRRNARQLCEYPVLCCKLGLSNN